MSSFNQFEQLERRDEIVAFVLYQLSVTLMVSSLFAYIVWHFLGSVIVTLGGFFAMMIGVAHFGYVRNTRSLRLYVPKYRLVIEAVSPSFKTNLHGETIWTELIPRLQIRNREQFKIRLHLADFAWSVFDEVAKPSDCEAIIDVIRPRDKLIQSGSTFEIATPIERWQRVEVSVEIKMVYSRSTTFFRDFEHKWMASYKLGYTYRLIDGKFEIETDPIYLTDFSRFR